MKTVSQPLKNVVSEEEVKTKDAFQAFLSHFNTLKKSDRVFYETPDRRMDYNALTDEAKRAGITKIPTEVELQELV